MRTRLLTLGVFVLSAMLLSSCSKNVYMFTSFHEPANEGLRFLYSEDGYKWKGIDGIFLEPEVGEQKIMRDPSIAQGPDGTYHLVWTTGWKGTKGFGYASSKDLINWTPQRSIEVMAKEPETVNVWAPEIFYDDEEKQFIIIWASTIPFRFPKGIEDENNNHRMYYTTTRDFQTFSEAKIFFDPGFSVIDAVIVKEAKGKYVLVLKDNTRPNRYIQVAHGSKAVGPYTNISEPFTGYLTEGPTVVKPGKDWLIYYDSYGTKGYGAAKTTDFKEFADASDEIEVPDGHKHGTIFMLPKSKLKALLKN